MIRDKKGFLLAEETLKMILAVISIGILAFLLFSIYNSSQQSRELVLAEESVDFLIQEIDSETSEIEVLNPSGWVILSWNSGSEQEIPQSCETLDWDGCICIAEGVGFFGKLSSDYIPGVDDITEKLRKKSDEGACKNNPDEFSVAGPIKIENPPITLSVDYENKIITKAG